MECKVCHETYTPPQCPNCGAALGDGTCPACLAGAPTTCSACGTMVELRKKGDPAPQQTAAPAANAAPEAGGAPYPVPPQFQAGAYPGYTPPTQKMKIGGWLLVFVLFNAGMLIYAIVTLFITAFSSTTAVSVEGMGANFGLITTIVSIAISLLISVLPPAVMLYYVYDRNPKFKGWYTAITVIQIISLVLSVISVVITIAMMPLTMQTMAEMGQAMPAIDTASLVVSVVISAVFTVVYIAFLVYIKKSERVKRTFDPLNNPPKV